MDSGLGQETAFTLNGRSVSVAPRVGERLSESLRERLGERFRILTAGSRRNRRRAAMSRHWPGSTPTSRWRVPLPRGSKRGARRNAVSARRA